MSSIPVCLSIAGLDPSGGAGVIADVRTFSAFRCFPAAAVTSITFQNTSGVYGAINQTAASVRGQVEPVLTDYSVASVKTGMLPTREVIAETAQLLTGLSAPVVVDPVVRSTSGFDLIDAAALRSLIELLFPIADLVTPNKVEAERITGISIESVDDIASASDVMRSMGARNVLIKGGHALPGSDPSRATDYLFLDDHLEILEGKFIETTATHGTGCILSSAIAANLAHGKSLTEAVGAAKDFVARGIRNSPHLGHGNSPIDISFDYFATGTKTGDR